MYKIIIDGTDDEVTYTKFKTAIFFCEREYGYGGKAWEEVKKSNDLYVLESFLKDDGVFAEVNEY